jgi:hypothetical protein
MNQKLKRMIDISQNKTIVKTVWVTCLITAFIWLVGNTIFTPIESNSENTRLGYLIYGLFQLFTYGLVPLFLLALSIITLDLVIFRGAEFSRRQLIYETCILVFGMFIIGLTADATGTGILLCLGIVIGQFFRSHRIESKLHSKPLA